MVTMLFFILFLGALLAVRSQCRRLAIAILSFALALFLLIGCGPLTNLLLRPLQTTAPLSHPDWKPNNVIIVLGFGLVRWQDKVAPAPLGYSRIFEAAHLYFDCKKSGQRCRILTTGGDPKKQGASEAEAMTNALEGIGIPASAILLESKSGNTFQNARYSHDLLGSDQPDQVVLVTSGVHMTRSMLYFSHFFRGLVAAPADFVDVRMSFQPYAYNFLYADFALHEYAGMMLYHIFNLLGWNPPRLR